MCVTRLIVQVEADQLCDDRDPNYVDQSNGAQNMPNRGSPLLAFFLENSVLWLSGNADLLSIKTRAATEGRLDRVQDPLAKGRLMLAAELINVVAIPVAVIVLGLLRLLRRREKGAS